MAQIDTGQLKTIETWNEYVSNSVDAGFWDYIDCNQHFVELLDRMLANAQTATDFTQGITELLEERKKFIDFAENNLG